MEGVALSSSSLKSHWSWMCCGTVVITGRGMVDMVAGVMCFYVVGASAALLAGANCVDL